MKKVFTTGQAAKICKVAPRMVAKWFDSGRLRGYRIPGSQDRRIPREHLRKFMKEHGLSTAELDAEEMVKILVITTDTALVAQFKERLPETEFKFEIADQILEIGFQLTSFCPEIIVIDLAIGRADALGTVAKVRGLSDFGQTPIFGLVPEDEAEPEALTDAGFTELWRRPIEVPALADSIRASVEMQRNPM